MTWKERLRKWAPRVGYPLFYLFCFALFASLLFPYDAVKDKLVASFNAQQRGTGGTQELSIDSMGFYWFTGVRAKGIKLTSFSPDPKQGPSVLTIEEARIRLGIFSALIGNRDISYSLDALGGTIEGSYQEKGKDRAVDVELKDVDLAKMDAIAQSIGLPVAGKLTGNITLQLPEGKASKGTGTVNLEAADVAIGDGKAKLKNALDWPKLSVGTLTFQAEAKEGVLKVTKFSAGGKDLELSGEGRVQMRELATQSSLDLNVRFKINDSFRGKSDITKNLFGAPGSAKGGDIELFVPEFRAAKRSDGFYGFHVRGLLDKPMYDPQPMGGGPGVGGPSLGGTLGGGTLSPAGGGGGGGSPFSPPPNAGRP